MRWQGRVDHKRFLLRSDQIRETSLPRPADLDDTHALIGDDMVQMLRRGRKYSLSLILIGQYLSQFRKGDLDMVPTILNLCRTFACFQQSSPAIRAEPLSACRP